jgi:diaminopimelate epimerase
LSKVALKFTKMHGLGNDFVVIETLTQRFEPTPRQLCLIADRHLGVGCDQILLVAPPGRPDVDFRYRIFNADGAEVEQCGNGARCLMRFVRDHGLTDNTEIRLETAAGVITPRLESDGQISVNMGMPRFEPQDIPFVARQRSLVYSLDVGAVTVEISALSMGNPHAVLVVSDVEAAPVASQGPLIECHPRFPRHANVDYIQIIDPAHIKFRVYERGVGETLASGTGACAAAVAGMQRGLLQDEITVHTRGGDMTVKWAGEGQPVYMTGPATRVYEGEIDL